MEVHVGRQMHIGRGRIHRHHHSRPHGQSAVLVVQEVLLSVHPQISLEVAMGGAVGQLVV